MRLTNLLLLAVFLVPSTVFAHSGSTDSSGGHYCWTNCEQYGLKTGEYHYHDTNNDAVATYDNNGSFFDKALAERLHGNILLQVEEHGEAWYIRSSDSMRYYMKDGAAAYEMMRYFSLGITDTDLATISSVADTTEMNNSTSVCDSNVLAERLAREILLQVEEHGEAWYVDPVKCRSIYMADGSAAYEIMRYLGLRITNIDLEKIVAGTWNSGEDGAVESVVEPIEYSFSGFGSDYTEEFELGAGVAFVSSTHTNGDSNFISHLLDSSGLIIGFLTNTIGDYQGRTMISIDQPGEYLIDIDADGDWSFEISQNQSVEALTVPLNVGGAIESLHDFSPDEYQYMTDDVVGPIYLESGLHTAHLSQLGTSNFIVHLVNNEGEIEEFLANEVGSAILDEAFNVSEGGNYYLTIEGDGAWKIELE